MLDTGSGSPNQIKGSRTILDHASKPTSGGTFVSLDVRQIGASDGEDGSDVGATILKDALDRIELELARFRPFHFGIQLRDQCAADHVANYSDVVTSGKQHTAIFAFGEFTLS